jgi:hypothetical protein
VINALTKAVVRHFSTCRRRYWFEVIKGWKVGGRSKEVTAKQAVLWLWRDRDWAAFGNVEVDLDSVYAKSKSTLVDAVSNRFGVKVETAESIVRDCFELNHVRSIWDHYNAVHSTDSAIKQVGAAWHVCKDTIPRPRGNTAYTFEGRLCVVEVEGAKWLLVRKVTTSSRVVDQIIEVRKSLDWISHWWLANRKLGPVSGILYDVIRPKAPQVPKRNQCRRCSGSGRIKVGKQPGVPVQEGPEPPSDSYECGACHGSGLDEISSAPCDTTPAIYRSALMDRYGAEDKWPVKLASMCRDLERWGDSFAHRVFLPINPTMADEVEKDLYMTTREMIVSRKTERWPRSFGACRGRGAECPLLRICAGMVSEDEPLLVPRTGQLSDEDIL